MKFSSCATFRSVPFGFPVFCFGFSYSLSSFSSWPQRKEVEPLKAHPEETSPTVQAEQPRDTQEAEAAAQTSSQVSEVEIPSVGKIPVRSDADGYNEEVQIPVQGLIN